MGVDMSGGHESMDYREHERTYSLFVRGTIILTLVSLFTMAFLAIFVA